ncbi:hypothetical protein BDV23DRAFT_172666 [Aspergillus alliaceus]|uniref:Fumarylacetoacetase-like C-terminal domain-containing protein n=1 Tax=Petromyces alliaceus TaxID=209559 RepID=A0A5N7C8R1_PETAA|nr:hypothetical protein BDV23DRAFT_172666 [Aspergillus alliaceus]
MTTFSRLIRFLAKDGHVYYGDAIMPTGVGDFGKVTKAYVIQGDILGQHRVTDQVADVKMLPAPLARKDVATNPTSPPAYPVLFYKPITSITGPHDDIPVSSVAQDGERLDYECELVIASSLPKLICDPNALTISTIVNEQIVQSFSTKDMIFGVAETVSFLSQGTTLLPGDLFFTGTVGSCVDRVVFDKPDSKL